MDRDRALIIGKSRGDVLITINLSIRFSEKTIDFWGRSDLSQHLVCAIRDDEALIQPSINTMPNFYVVVADSAIAKLFSVEGKTGDLVLVANLVSPDARVHDRELQSDKPGRVFDIKGEGRHSTDSDRSPKQQISMRFASEIADRIDRDFKEKLFDRLYLIAEPQFLGLLKKSIRDEISNVMSDSIPKNLTRHDLGDIRKALPVRL